MEKISQPQEPKGDLEEMINSASSFEELFVTLTKIGEIQGSQEVFKSDRLIELVNGIRKQGLSLSVLTRTSGLREKVSELLVADPVFQENNTLHGFGFFTESQKTVLRDPVAVSLISSMFQRENMNKVVRDGYQPPISPGQLQRFLEEVPEPEALDKYIEKLFEAKQGQIHSLEEKMNDPGQSSINRENFRLEMYFLKQRHDELQNLISEDGLVLAKAVLYPDMVE